jgi:hypothetical protein
MLRSVVGVFVLRFRAADGKLMPRVNSPLATRREGDAVAVPLCWLDLEHHAGKFLFGCTMRCMAVRSAGAEPGQPAHQHLHPKLLIAEPKNINVCLPARRLRGRIRARRLQAVQLALRLGEFGASTLVASKVSRPRFHRRRRPCPRRG